MKYLYLFITLFFIPIKAQKSPTIGVTDFNFITEHEENTYNNDTWINNIFDTGWDITAFDNTGQFNYKRFPYGGIDNLDGCISLDNWDMKYVKIKSNDASRFKFSSIHLKPDSNLNVTFIGYVNGVEVPNATKNFRTFTPERWSKFDFEDTPAFGDVDEIRIFLNVRTYFLGIDEITIASTLKTQETSQKPLQLIAEKGQLIVFSPIKTSMQIFSNEGKLVLEKEIKSSNNNFDIQQYPKGVYIIKYLYNNKYYQQKILFKN